MSKNRKIDACIADLRTWMIKNKLKFNDSKIELLVVISPTSKVDLSDICAKVGTSIMKPASKSRNLGEIFDDHLNFYAHIGNVCKSAYFYFHL